MTISTCYTSELKAQLEIDGNGSVIKANKVDKHLMGASSQVCLDARRFCVDTFLKEWDYLLTFPSSARKGVTHRKRAADLLIHSTKDSSARYGEFDERFPYMPSIYTPLHYRESAWYGQFLQVQSQKLGTGRSRCQGQRAGYRFSNLVWAYVL